MDRNAWESALKSSTLWGMCDIRSMAIKSLEDDLDSVDKILLGQAYGVLDWLLSGYNTLVKRDRTISGQEGRSLGPDTTAKLHEIREAGIKADVPIRTSQSRYKGFKVPMYDYEFHTQSLFSQELADAAVSKIRAVESQRIDGNPAGSVNSQSVQNGQFYMECIVFLVGIQIFE